MYIKLYVDFIMLLYNKHNGFGTSETAPIDYESCKGQKRRRHLVFSAIVLV